MVIERCFRSLKRAQIKMTPMYHWLSRRIESHVKICVLALMVERIGERSCHQPWSKIRGALRKLQVTKFFDLNHRVCLRNEISAETRNILNQMNISPPQQLVHLEKTM
jgi:transposase